MSAFLTLSNLTLTAADGTPLVPAFDLAFGRERTGLVGPNGCGKSTLLTRMAGPPGGPVGRGGSVALVRQSWPDLSLSVAEALEVAGGLDRLARLEAGQGGDEDFAEADWELPARLAAALARVGFGEEVLTRRLATLSGGQCTRVALARAILAAPDLLLLDEPTNNLDAEGRALVAELIAGWRGGVVVASHDRALLGAMDRIVELSPKGMRLTGGGYAAWAEARAAREAREAATLDRAERELARVEREVQRQREKKARRDAAGKASRARGDQPKVLLDARAERAAKSGARERAVGHRLEASAEALRAGAEAQIHRRDPLRIEATAAEAHGAVLRAEDVALRRDGFALGPFDLVVTAGERLALSGPNGAGKSTLLALLRGELMPERGEIHRVGAVAALDQHAEGFAPEVPLVESLRRLHPALTDNAARALLARFGFRNRAAERLAGTLSGGEKLRAGLAAALGGGAPPALLTLDEPTNHLDLETVALLEAALADYPGALLVVSHDRVFLETIGVTRELTLARGRLI